MTKCRCPNALTVGTGEWKKKLSLKLILSLQYRRHGGEMFDNKGAQSTHVITHGYDSKDFASSSAGGQRESDRIAICHSGTLARDRNPLKLWDAIAEMSGNTSFQIKLLGSTDLAIVEAIKARHISYDDLSYVSHARAVAAIQDADILFLVQNEAVAENVKGRISGKIFEDLTTGRVILCIGDPELLPETWTGI